MASAATLDGWLESVNSGDLRAKQAFCPLGPPAARPPLGPASPGHRTHARTPARPRPLTNSIQAELNPTHTPTHAFPLSSPPPPPPPSLLPPPPSSPSFLCFASARRPRVPHHPPSFFVLSAVLSSPSYSSGARGRCAFVSLPFPSTSFPDPLIRCAFAFQTCVLPLSSLRVRISASKCVPPFVSCATTSTTLTLCSLIQPSLLCSPPPSIGTGLSNSIHKHSSVAPN